MRGLNLSRLAKASEGSYFKTEQAAQASALRNALSESELTTLRQRTRPDPSVDILPEISAQSAYRRLDIPASAPTPPRSVVSRIRSASVEARALRDPPIMRALGANKLALYQQYAPRASARPLPGGDKYADGAVLGMTSFSVATAFVASLGLVVGVGVYLNPWIGDGVKEGTRRFGNTMDAVVGERMRERVRRVRERGPVVGDERREWLGGLLRSAVGGRQLDQRRNAQGDVVDGEVHGKG